MEERIVLCQMLKDLGLIASGKRIVDLGAGIY